jgi:pantothenate kinase
MLEVPEATLRERLAMRWRGYGLTPDEIHRKVEEVDLPNGHLVRAESAMADYSTRTSQGS